MPGPRLPSQDSKRQEYTVELNLEVCLVLQSLEAKNAEHIPARCILFTKCLSNMQYVLGTYQEMEIRRKETTLALQSSWQMSVYFMII